MTTATAERPQTAKAQTTPAFPGLAIDVNCDLERKNRLDVDNYHRDASAFEKRFNTLHESRRRLLDDAMDTTISDILRDAAKLNADRCKLEHELAILRWRRFDLLPKLVQDFTKAVAEADKFYEITIAAELKAFESMGITVASMPAYDVNPGAGEHQLHHRVKQELSVLSATDAQNRAQSDLRVLRSQIGVTPRPDSCAINWQGAPAGIASDIARMAGLDATAPKVPQPLLAEKVRRILRETGLVDAATLPTHIDIVEQIAALLSDDTQYRPLGTAPANKLDDVRRLLSQLPQTREINHFLAATKNGPVNHKV